MLGCATLGRALPPRAIPAPSQAPGCRSTAWTTVWPLAAPLPKTQARAHPRCVPSAARTRVVEIRPAAARAAAGPLSSLEKSGPEPVRRLPHADPKQEPRHARFEVARRARPRDPRAERKALESTPGAAPQERPPLGPARARVPRRFPVRNARPRLPLLGGPTARTPARRSPGPQLAGRTRDPPRRAWPMHAHLAPLKAPKAARLGPAPRALPAMTPNRPDRWATRVPDRQRARPAIGLPRALARQPWTQGPHRPRQRSKWVPAWDGSSGPEPGRPAPYLRH